MADVKGRFNPACDAAGLKGFRFHDLRHTAATLLMEAGAPLHAVQRILRHSNLRLTTETYGHLADGYLKNEVDRLSFGLPRPAEPAAQAPAMAANDPAFYPASTQTPVADPAKNDGPPSGRAVGAFWSGKPDLNRRHSRWQRDALPTELFPRNVTTLGTKRGRGSQAPPAPTLRSRLILANSQQYCQPDQRLTAEDR